MFKPNKFVGTFDLHLTFIDPTFFIAVLLLDRKMIENLYMRKIQLAAEKGLLMIITFNWEQFPRAFSCPTYRNVYIHVPTFNNCSFLHYKSHILNVAGPFFFGIDNLKKSKLVCYKPMDFLRLH